LRPRQGWKISPAPGKSFFFVALTRISRQKNANSKLFGGLSLDFERTVTNLWFEGQHGALTGTRMGYKIIQ
jgi:hypothetical protein